MNRVDIYVLVIYVIAEESPYHFNLWRGSIKTCLTHTFIQHIKTAYIVSTEKEQL